MSSTTKTRKTTPPLQPQTPEAARLPAVRPNAGVQAWYQRRLTRLVKRMSRSVSYWVVVEYNGTELANDALDVNDLARELQRLTIQWQTTFGRLARTLSRQLAERVTSHADKQLETGLRAKGFKVKFQQTQEMKEAFASVVQENVDLIKSIPEQYLTQVKGLVMRSAGRGRDVAYLAEELKKRFDITHRRAVFIARDQNNKATSVMTAARQMQLGITQGMWKHSHAGKQPRISHVRADGKLFQLDKGMKIDGELIMPGEEPNCRCVWEPIIPGFEA